MGFERQFRLWRFHPLRFGFVPRFRTGHFCRRGLWREAVTQDDCRFAQFPPVFGVEPFHEGGEVNHIPLCPAPEALENPLVEMGRERR